MHTRIDFTKMLIKDAGQHLQKLMASKIEIETKADETDFVTNVDKEIEMFLVEGIQKKYQHQDFLTEEATTDRIQSDDLWIIDPIDGTTNFIYQQKNFAISVAYYHQKRPVFGIVYDVVADKMFVGIKGQGAMLNGEILKPLNQTQTLKESIINANLASLPLFTIDAQTLLKNITSHRYLGSATLEICMVAENKTSAYITNVLNVWDVAAAVIILKEVGGTFFFGGLHDEIFLSKEKGVFLASQNNTIKEALMNFMKSNAIHVI